MSDEPFGAGKEPTQARLMECVSYNPQTGIFTRLLTLRGRAHKGAIAGTMKDNGYLHFAIDGVKRGSHRYAWLYMTGEYPKNDIDHINGNRADNRFCNLRAVSRSVNLQNQRAPQQRNKSTGVLGAYPTGKGRFTSRIGVFGKDKYLGCFATAEDAHAAYIKAKRELHEGCTI